MQLPGVEDPNRIKELIGKTAQMTFRLLDETANLAGPPPPGVDYLPMQNNANQKVPVRRRVEVDGANLTDARAGQNPQTGEWVVNFTFDSIGARRFGDVTRANVGKPFAIVLDNNVISAPVIREPITGGRGQISGSFDARERHRPCSAAARRRAPGAAHRGRGAHRRARARRRQHPRRRDLACGRVRARCRLHGDLLRAVRLVCECRAAS